MQKVYSFMWWNMSLVSFESWELILQFVSSGLTKLDETIGYCWCPIVMRWSLWLQQRLLWLHHCDVIHWDNKAVSQWLLTFNLCVSVTWPLTCAFHIPCTHTPEIIDMHRGVCDNVYYWSKRLIYIPGISDANLIQLQHVHIQNWTQPSEFCLMIIVIVI